MTKFRQILYAATVVALTAVPAYAQGGGGGGGGSGGGSTGSSSGSSSSGSMGSASSSSNNSGSSGSSSMGASGMGSSSTSSNNGMSDSGSGSMSSTNNASTGVSTGVSANASRGFNSADRSRLQGYLSDMTPSQRNDPSTVNNATLNVGDTFPRSTATTTIPSNVTSQMQTAPSGYSYVQSGSNVYMIDNTNRRIIDRVGSR